MDNGSTYDLEPKELRRAIRAVQNDPKRLLLLEGKNGVRCFELMVGMTCAFPELGGRVYRTQLVHETDRFTSPWIFGNEFLQCSALEQVATFASENLGEGTVLEILHLTREPRSASVAEGSVVAEDIKAVVEGRGDYRFFNDWSMETDDHKENHCIEVEE